ncbi:receptor-like protein 33 [Papaver somniferum]|uniref:receptor-like protein 33 n=1 Tax=Papaver somniferum TaxID=3469 RepID=UPI000E6F9857|nr:receptor-like protein 33 [Papaver somniferum]
MRLLSFTTRFFFLVFFFLTVLELNSSNIWVHGQCLNHQKTLLIQLNKSLISSSHILPSIIKFSSKRSSWRSNTDCCKFWSGVGCDRSGHVTSLDLSNEFIHSELNSTSSLFKLQYLESLNLAFNNFILTPIPPGFGRLINLTYLNLSSSGFSGQIPVELSRMIRLVTLDLSTFLPVSNSLTLKNPDLGTLIRNLKEIKVLWLDGVNISAHGSKWCKAVSSSNGHKLQVLSLSNCYLSGPFDKSVLRLRSLYDLRLDRNNISAKVPEFFSEFRNLTSLHLNGCGLYGKFPDSVFQLRTLRSLQVSDNKLLRGTLPEFSEDKLLQDLVLSDTSFAGELPHSIGNLTLLSRLELDNCSFNGLIPTSISNLNQLQFLYLSMNGFTGVIPSINWPTSLTDINLSYNQFTGPIPPEWNKLPKLVNLNLKNNSFNGTIPSALFTLPSLQKLELTMNQFTGGLDEFPSGSSSSLEYLDISMNKLQGPIPMSIFDLSRIKILTLSSNNFNGTLSLETFFHKFKNLSSLDLSGNKLSITFISDNFTLFPQIRLLMLRSCNLSVFPAFLSNQSRLNYLDLSENQMKGKIPNWIHLIGEGYLGYLNLSYNFLEDPQLPLPPNSFNSLSILDLRSNRLQGKNPILPSSAIILDYSLNNFTTIIQNISSYTSFTLYLSLSNNQLIGEIPQSICQAGYLQVLDLSHNNLSGEIPSCLVGFIPSLAVLNLRGNNFDGIIPEIFPESCTLETLDLNGNQFEGQLPRSLVNCAMLEVLDLGNNQLTGDFPSWLGSMSNLRVLVLRSNRFHGPLGNTTGLGFQKLQIVDISFNKFTGTLCSKCFFSWTGMMVNVDETQSNHQILGFKFLELSRLYYQNKVTVTSKVLDIELVKFFTTFAFIDFSNNEFEGEIPRVIGNLSSLYALNLSRNAFSGTVPSSIGNLGRLESLDLSQNKLTGEIPLQLTELTFLSVLNLSFNQLEGKIPSGSQFQTFEVNSFEGNDGLCGAPISNSCTITESSPQNGWKPDNELHEFDWVLLMVSFMGFLVGAGMIIGPQFFWKKGREWANEHLNKFLNIT